MVVYDPSQMTLAPNEAETQLPEPDMSLVFEPRTAPPAFPIDVLPPSLGQWATEQAEIASAPVDYTVFGMLAHVGALIGNSLAVSPWEGWEEPPILWVALVGLPSSGKTPSQAPIDWAINTVEKELQADYPQKLSDYHEKLAVSKAHEKQWAHDVKTAISNGDAAPSKPKEAHATEKPVRPQLVVLDSTIEALADLLVQNPRGLLQKRDELAGWFHGMGRYNAKSEAERAQWLQAWSCKEIKVNRKNLDEPIDIPRACVSVLGGIQPDKLRDITCGSNDGLSARFLYVWPRALPPKRPTKTPKQYTLSALFRYILTNLPVGDTPRCIPFDETGATLLETYRLELHERINDAGGHYLGFLGKQAGYVVRLSLVLQVLDWANNSVRYPLDTIQPVMVERAIALSRDYLIPMAQRVFADSHKPADAVRTDAMVAWMVQNRPARINVRSVYRSAKIEGIKSAKDAKPVIDELVQAHWLLPAPSREGEHPGRQKQDYIANPRVWDALETLKDGGVS